MGFRGDMDSRYGRSAINMTIYHIVSSFCHIAMLNSQLNNICIKY